MQYKRLCEGLNTKGKLIPATADIFKHIKDRKKDHYVSLYKYNENHKQIFDKTGTIAGIDDTVTDVLLWDFDDEKNFEQARSDSKELIKRLKAAGYNEMEIYYSGNKGTHVGVRLQQDISSEEFKQITQKFAEGLKSYDSTVSNPSRIVRVPFTKHPKSNLYKIDLLEDELENLPLDEIKKIASDDTIQPEIPSIKSYPKPYVDKKEEKRPNMDTKEFSGELDLDYSQKPKWLSHWKYALLNGYFPEGTKHSACMIMAATLKAQGLPVEVAYRMVKGAFELQYRRFEEEEVNKADVWQRVSNVYDPSWNGGTYAEENFPVALKNYLEELGIPKQDHTTLSDQQIERVSEGFSDFTKYAEDIDKYTMQFGIPELDNKLKIRKGHLIGLIAPPGVGKTSLAITIANNMSKQGTHSFMASYDMFRHNVYQKLIQRHTGLSEDALFQVFVDKDEQKIDKWKKLLDKEYENVSFCFKVGQTIEELKQSIQLQEEKTGQPIELVIVDYLELVLTKSSDPTASSAEAAQGLREIANEGRVVVMLLQPNKMSSKPNEPLTSYNSAKGSSAIAQAATAILTAHRPGLSSENPEYDNFFGINCVKNRNGPLFALDFGWKGKTQTIYTLSEVERQELKELRQRLKDQVEDDF